MVLKLGSAKHEPSQLTANKLTANQWFRYSDLVTHFVAVISSQSEGLGKMALGIVKIYLGAPFSANQHCSRSVCSQSVVMDPAKHFEGSQSTFQKNQNDAKEEEKIMYKIRFSGNLSFQTKLNKYNSL